MMLNLFLFYFVLYVLNVCVFVVDSRDWKNMGNLGLEIFRDLG